MTKRIKTADYLNTEESAAYYKTKMEWYVKFYGKVPKKVWDLYIFWTYQHRQNTKNPAI